jgi:hypothetical protein
MEPAMPASAALLGYGTIFAITDAFSPTTYVELGEVVDVTPPSISVDQVEVTHMQSPNRVKEYIAGLADYGEMQLTMNYIPSSDTDDRIIAWRDSGGNLSCRITYPSASSPRPTDTFDGFVLSYSPSIPVGDKMQVTLTVKVASAVARAG